MGWKVLGMTVSHAWGSQDVRSIPSLTALVRTPRSSGALNDMKAADSQDGSADKPSFASGLLPHEHTFSLSVAEQCDCLQKDLPRGVTAVTPAGPGLVLLTLRAGRADGYGARAWPLLVGGAGLGDEPELAKMLGVP